MNWFRFYHGAYKDPKVRNLRPELFKFWVNFLCVASDSAPRGTIESVDHLSRSLGLSKPLVKRLASELVALKLAHWSDTGTLTPHNWSERQKRSDDSGKTKRTQREKTCVESSDDPVATMSMDTNSAPPPLEKEIEKEEIPPDPHGGEESALILKSDPEVALKPTPAKRARKAIVPTEIPAWLSLEWWNKYVEMRIEMGDPLTEYAKKLRIQNLADMRDQGHDPDAILKQSVANQWKNLYLVKARDSGSYSGNQTPKPHEPAPSYHQYMLSPAEKFGNPQANAGAMN
jgi:hypothetical protein